MLIKEIADQLDAVSGNGVIKQPTEDRIPDRKAVIGILKDLQVLLFPGYYKNDVEGTTEQRLEKICGELSRQIRNAYNFSNMTDEHDCQEICSRFIAKLPTIKEFLLKDIMALYNGDPAAKCREEVLICYPGFYAISIYRLAHELYLLQVPLIPRIMTEYAHEKTGIDIHAGASIGEYFFIDHGTGIVVGETTVIGDHVKLYQGVTLGAKSFELDENGNPVKDIKRHPNIGNHVVIYANATILGGSTTIGDNCVIGGSVWLTHSVKTGETIYYSE